MKVLVKKGIVNISGNTVRSGISKPPIKSVVSVAVDPNAKVNVTGSGVKAISKIDPSGKVSKFSKFASFKL
jgi:hypothetical protein